MEFVILEVCPIYQTRNPKWNSLDQSTITLPSRHRTPLIARNRTQIDLTEITDDTPPQQSKSRAVSLGRTKIHKSGRFSIYTHQSEITAAKTTSLGRTQKISIFKKASLSRFSVTNSKLQATITLIRAEYRDHEDRDISKVFINHTIIGSE